MLVLFDYSLADLYLIMYNSELVMVWMGTSELALFVTCHCSVNKQGSLDSVLCCVLSPSAGKLSSGIHPSNMIYWFARQKSCVVLAVHTTVARYFKPQAPSL